MDRETSFGLSEIAGDCESGDGYFHTTLRIAADGGYVHHLSECLGEHEAGGVVEGVEGRLVFRMQASHDWLGPEPPLIPVAWDERRYLLHVDSVPSFCYAVHCFEEPRFALNGSYLLRGGDHLKVAEGLPELPESMAPLLA